MCDTSKRIAVIGSGISGLSCAWMLREHGFPVTIYEKHSKLGMDAESIDVQLPNDKMGRIDVPLRVFCPNYYPNLMKLYKAVNIPIVKADYCTTNLAIPVEEGKDIPWRHKTYFVYKNYKLFNHITIPYINSFSFVKLGWEYLWLLMTSPIHLQTDKDIEHKTIQQYLVEHKYSNIFINNVMLPALAGMCTCKTATVAQYPAPIIIDYLNKLALWGVARSGNGARQVVTNLSKGCELKLGSGVASITENKDGSKRVTELNGQWADFDVIVVSTQADLALSLVNTVGSPLQKEALACFPYEQSQVVVHRDISLLPEKIDDWSGVNFFVDPEKEMPMASIWMNKVQPALNPQTGRCFKTDDPHGDTRNGPLIQTWAPFKQPAKDKVLADAWFTRPIINMRAVEGMKMLEASQGDNNIYYAGSYAFYAVPLLESAICSGFSVAESLGCKRPWKAPENSPKMQFIRPKIVNGLLTLWQVRLFLVALVLFLVYFLG